MDKNYRPTLYYSLGALLSILLFIGVVCGFNFHLNSPMSYFGDVLWQLAVFKALAQGEWWPYTIPQSQFLAAPFHWNMADFLGADQLHYVFAKMLSWINPNPAFIFNFYFLCTFPLTTLAFMFAARQFRIPFSVAGVLGIAFAFLPYHVNRFGHLFLASYYLIPLQGMVALWVGSKVPLFFKYDSIRRKYRLAFSNKKSILTLVIAFLSGAAGVYYAFFFAVFALVAGVSAAYSKRRIFPLLSAMIIATTITVSSCLCILPNQIYYLQHGKNPAVGARNYLEAETYGLKLKMLLAPKSGHRFSLFNKLYANYQSSSHVEGYGESACFLGLLGFLVLWSRLFLLRKRDSALDRLSLLWISGTLLSVVGGLGVLLAATVIPQIRCYNRISIFLCFFGLFGLAFFLNLIRNRISLWIRVISPILGLGWIVYDQITPDLAYSYSASHVQYESDQEFFRQIEKQLAPGSSVLQLPYQPFPESPPVHEMDPYGHFRAYLHTTSLRWSYGAIKGRPESIPIEKVSQFPLDLAQVRAMGYSAIYVDRDAYVDHGQTLEKVLSEQTGSNPLVSPNQKLSFFELKKYPFKNSL